MENRTAEFGARVWVPRLCAGLPLLALPPQISGNRFLWSAVASVFPG